MSRIATTPILASLFLTLACAERPPENGAAVETGTPNGTAETGLEMPNWMTVDHGARTVNLSIVAGQDSSNNHWNFNGYANGEATIVVPQGYTVTIDFRNADPATPHSLGVEAKQGDFPATFEPSPVFEGALTANATDPAGATASGKSETVSFTAATAGDYSLVCYVPAHAAAGMWVGFRVAPDQSAGVQMR